MIYIIIEIIILAIFLIILSQQKKKNTEETKACKEYPYTKKYLLTKTEYAFYNVLKEQCDKSNIIICPKVRMEDFLQVTDKQNIMKYRGYIKSRHIDFMLCNSKLNIIAGLELDDNSHQTEKAKETDNFKDEVFKKIEIPLFRIKTNTPYNEQIESIINTLTIPSA